MDFRKKYRNYRPWILAKVKPTAANYLTGLDPATLWEFTSYPWREDDVAHNDGPVVIMARVVGDATTNARFVVRREVTAITWSAHRQKAYRAGFVAGEKFRAQEERKYHA